MDYAVGVALFIVGIILSVALHEMGHMVPAKRFGVRVSQFMVGFGPTLWSRTVGDTEYGFKAFLLGGYVRITGMLPHRDEVKPVRGTGWAARLIEDARETSMEDVAPGEEQRAFYRLSWWKKVIVMAGGPVMNLIIAIVAFTVVASGIGLQANSTTVSAVVECLVPANEDRDCEPGDAPTTAAVVGIEPGDVLVSINGEPIAFHEFESIRDVIGDLPGQTVPIVVERDGETLTLSGEIQSLLQPARDEYGRVVVDDNDEVVYEERGFLGVSPTLIRHREPIWGGAAITGEYLLLTGEAVVGLPRGVWHALQASFGGVDRDPEGVVSIVGAARLSGDVTDSSLGLGDKIALFLMLLGGVNLALFVFNMIPVLPLDGGHIAGALWQAVKNGVARIRNMPKPAPVDMARAMPFAYVMFGVLLVVGLVLMWADIVAPIEI